MRIEKIGAEWCAFADNGREVARAKDRALLDAYLLDAEMSDEELPAPAAPTTASSGPRPGPAGAGVKHTIRFWAYVDGERQRRTSDMRSGAYTWDATCACGWDSATGGSAMAAVDNLVAAHKEGLL